MIKRSIVLLVVISIIHGVRGQGSTCYQKGWTQRIERSIPSDFCLKEGGIVYQVFQKFDFNQDGILDIALKVGSDNLQDGDTLSFVVFSGQPDSSFIVYRRLNNLYPTHFSDYSLDVILENQSLQEIKAKYNGIYPVLNEIVVDGSKIVIRLYADVGYEYFYWYSFDISGGDWLLEKIEEYDTFEEEARELDSDMLGSSIEGFSYFRYIEGEDF